MGNRSRHTIWECTAIASAAAYAFWRSRRATLRAYFAAQVANCLVWGIALWLWGWNSWEYSVAFVLAESIVFAAMLPLVHAATYYCETRAWVFLLSACIGIAAAKYSIYGEPQGWGDWIGMWDTGTLTAMAIATTIGAAYLVGTQKKLARVLMTMWLALASFHFSYTRNWYMEVWSAANRWVPGAIVAIGCLWLARIDHEYSN